MLSAWPRANAQDADLELSDYDKEIAAIEKELMAELSIWDHSFDLRLGSGYKENVTVNPTVDAFFVS